MTEGSYRARLEKDLPRWQAQGWVAPDSAAAILASLGGPRTTLKMSGVVAVLGALLLSVGVIGLVAANWEAIPRVVRFSMLVATIGASYGFAVLLHGWGHSLFAEAALLLAGLVFAGSIALVGQTYHLAGEFSDALLMWTLGCLAAAVLTRSVAQTILTIAGSAYWIALLALEASVPPHWPSLALVLAALALATRLGSRPARGAALLVLGFWICVAVVTCASTYRWSPAGGMALLASLALAFWTSGAALTGWRDRFPRLAALGLDLLAVSLPAFLLSLGFLQVAPKLAAAGARETWPVLIILALTATAASAAIAFRHKIIGLLDAAAITVLSAGSVLFALWLNGDGVLPRMIASLLVVGASLWAVSLGDSGRLRGRRSLGLAAFGLEIAYVYLETFGTMLDTALALLAGGALFLVVAVTLFQIDRLLSARRAALAGAST